MNPKKCKTCGEELTSHTCYTSDMKDGRRRCKKCSYKQRRELYDKRRELEKEVSRTRYYAQRGSSYSENKRCSMHLGVYIAENLIENMFEDIVRAPMHNKGYDFILKSGETIDVKASNLSTKNNWFLTSIETQRRTIFYV